MNVGSPEAGRSRPQAVSPLGDRRRHPQCASQVGIHHDLRLQQTSPMRRSEQSMPQLRGAVASPPCGTARAETLFGGFLPACSPSGVFNEQAAVAPIAQAMGTQT